MRISTLSLLLAFLSACETSSLPEPLVILKKDQPDYKLSIIIYKIDVINNYSHLYGSMTVDCHSCEEGKVYIFNNINISAGNQLYTTPHLSNSFTSVSPSFVFYNDKKRLHQFEVMWSLPIKLPFVVTTEDLNISIREKNNKQ